MDYSYSDDEFEKSSGEETQSRDSLSPLGDSQDTAEYLSEDITPFRPHLTPTRSCLIPKNKRAQKQGRKLVFGRTLVKFYYASKEEREFKKIIEDENKLDDPKDLSFLDMDMDEMDGLDQFVSRTLKYINIDKGTKPSTQASGYREKLQNPSAWEKSSIEPFKAEMKSTCEKDNAKNKFAVGCHTAVKDNRYTLSVAEGAKSPKNATAIGRLDRHNTAKAVGVKVQKSSTAGRQNDAMEIKTPKRSLSLKAACGYRSPESRAADTPGSPQSTRMHQVIHKTQKRQPSGRETRADKQIKDPGDEGSRKEEKEIESLSSSVNTTKPLLPSDAPLVSRMNKNPDFSTPPVILNSQNHKCRDGDKSSSITHGHVGEYVSHDEPFTHKGDTSVVSEAFALQPVSQKVPKELIVQTKMGESGKWENASDHKKKVIGETYNVPSQMVFGAERRGHEASVCDADLKAVPITIGQRAGSEIGDSGQERISKNANDKSTPSDRQNVINSDYGHENSSCDSGQKTKRGEVNPFSSVATPFVKVTPADVSRDLLAEPSTNKIDNIHSDNSRIDISDFTPVKTNLVHRFLLSARCKFQRLKTRLKSLNCYS